MTTTRKPKFNYVAVVAIATRDKVLKKDVKAFLEETTQGLFIRAPQGGAVEAERVRVRSVDLD